MAGRCFRNVVGAQVCPDGWDCEGTDNGGFQCIIPPEEEEAIRDRIGTGIYGYFTEYTPYDCDRYLGVGHQTLSVTGTGRDGDINFYIEPGGYFEAELVPGRAYDFGEYSIEVRPRSDAPPSGGGDDGYYSFVLAEGDVIFFHAYGVCGL